MSNSPLVDYTKISPNSSARTAKIGKITIHHMAGNLSVETCANVFATTERQASSNYGIGTDGRVGLYVDESRRAWTSSNRENDNVAVTIEVANDGGDPDWHVSDKALAKLIDLCTDICKRNGIAKLNFTGDKSGNLTMHKWFASTACPGPYLESKFPYIAEEVNKRLGHVEAPTEPEKPEPEEPKAEATTLYRVQTGAYPRKDNAMNMKAKLEAAGFKTYLVQADGWYKVQVGAFSKKTNAEAQAQELRATGFQTFITTQFGEPVEEKPTTPLDSQLKELDRVKMAKDAPVYGTERTFQSWVYSKTLYVRQVDGDRIVISILREGDITGVVHRKYLTKV